MTNATAFESIKVDRFEFGETCVEDSTVLDKFAAKVRLLIQTSNFSCTKCNA